MTRANWSHAALDDLTSIRAYLVQFDADLAERELAELILAARWLADCPHAGPALGVQSVRKWRPRGSRYVILYTPSTDGIDVARVRHVRDDWRPERA